MHILQNVRNMVIRIKLSNDARTKIRCDPLYAFLFFVVVVGRRDMQMCDFNNKNNNHKKVNNSIRLSYHLLYQRNVTGKVVRLNIEDGYSKISHNSIQLNHLSRSCLPTVWKIVFVCCYFELQWNCFQAHNLRLILPKLSLTRHLI